MSKPLSVRVEPVRLSRWQEGKEKMGIGSMSGYVKYCVDKVTNEVMSKKWGGDTPEGFEMIRRNGPC